MKNLINVGKIDFETPGKPDTTKNPLPNHGGLVNAISEENDKIYKKNISKVNYSVRWVWNKLFEVKVID